MDEITVDPHAVIASLERTIGQQAGMIARYEQVIRQLQEQIAERASTDQTRE